MRSRWSTDETADTQVDYGTTTAYGSSTALNTTLAVSHSQTLSGLGMATLYHYRVKSRDGAGDLAASADATFATQRSGGKGNHQTTAGTLKFSAADATSSRE